MHTALLIASNVNNVISFLHPTFGKIYKIFIFFFKYNNPKTTKLLISNHPIHIFYEHYKKSKIKILYAWNKFKL